MKHIEGISYISYSWTEKSKKTSEISYSKVLTPGDIEAAEAISFFVYDYTDDIKSRIAFIQGKFGFKFQDEVPVTSKNECYFYDTYHKDCKIIRISRMEIISPEKALDLAWKAFGDLS